VLQNPDLKRMAINALGQALLGDIAPANRCNAAAALGEYGEEAIPFLSQALETEPNPEVRAQIIASLQQIRERAANPLRSRDHPDIRYEGDPLSRSRHVLHLSDLHMTTSDQANLWSGQLADDLRHELHLSHLDALILSGDIANYSTPEEYQAAQLFLDHLRQDFPLDRDRIVIVPGNHDLNWQLAKAAYTLKDREDCTPEELQEGCYIPVSDEVVRVRDDAQYQQRFEHFSAFYRAIKNQDYPRESDQQYTLDKIDNLLFLGLNSAWQLDHHYKTRASINPNALSNALREINRNPDWQNCLKIAVWHHPLDSPGSDRIADPSFLERLAVAGFRFFLHGHIHKAETSLFRYDLSREGRQCDRVCAGTFGAPTRELIPGYPWQYNLLTFEENQLTVKTRRREEENGAWKPDARWLQGAGENPLPYYEIEL
jgi:3',5'-cyclic AMP phosphodiesterase CpdA